MALFLYETIPAANERQEIEAVIDRIANRVAAAGAEIIESQVVRGDGQIFTVVEVAEGGAPALDAAELGVTEVSDPAQVRLVGAELADVKAARPSAGYLVEWDIPVEIDMDTYLARKKANAPKYADVPEVDFLRTYVREDTLKCLCFYDAPDTDAVVRAREAVSTPISRLFQLA